MSTRIESLNLAGYRQADQSHDFSYDSGVIVVPIAGRTPGHRLLRMHGGVGLRTVKWAYAREGKPPIIPTMADTTGDTLISAHVVPTTPVSSATGKGYDWTVRGEYVYVQNDPRIVGEDALPVGQHPFVDRDRAAEANYLANTNNLRQFYSGETPFHSFIEAAAANVLTDSTGNYTWPLLGLPTLFTSSHILQD